MNHVSGELLALFAVFAVLAWQMILCILIA
jgi:hypothetical protein